jgi:hypothetical protein
MQFIFWNCAQLFWAHFRILVKDIYEKQAKEPKSCICFEAEREIQILKAIYSTRRVSQRI